MAVIEKLCRSWGDMSFEDLPPASVARQKDFLLDTLGVAVAGCHAPGVGEVVAMLKSMGGKAEARLLVDGQRLPSAHAAMANALMAHAVDFDDMHERAGVHVNVCVVPAALAVSEALGRVDGKRFLAAVVLGVDFVCRLALAVPLLRGWHATTVLGIYGAALAAAKILGLSPKQTADALGIAYSQSAGTRQGRLEGALTKRLQPALAAKAGVWSALLAQAGISGPREIFEGDWGILRVYTADHSRAHQQDGVAVLLDRFGEKFLGDELSIKAYPCCKATHTSIEAVSQLMADNGLGAEEIDGVEIFVSPECYNTVGHPFEIRTDPQVDAQFSIAYTVAAALQNRTVGLDDFREDAIRDKRRLALARRVRVTADPQLKDASSNVVNLGARVSLQARGRTFAARCDMAKGHPQKPLGRADVVRKFQSCLAFGRLSLPDAGRGVIEAIDHLEAEPDMGRLSTLLTA
jgi:2-methylcitrate dehydratase PrpD